MDSISRLRNKIRGSKAGSRLLVRGYKHCNSEHAIYVKNVEWRNIRLMNEIEEALRSLEMGDRKPLDEFIYYRLRWVVYNEINKEIVDLLKQI